MIRISFILFLALFSSVLPAFALGADSVVIVVNGKDPDSVVIGEYYAQQRGIPMDNIIRLETSTEETVPLTEYVETIANPLLNALLEEEWISGVKSSEKDEYGRERLAVAVSNISYLVTIRGIPIRFSNAPEFEVPPEQSNLHTNFQVNRGSVDSELALLAAPAGLPMAAYVPNPFFEGKSVQESQASRILKVSRLDGPTKHDVVRLIDRTLEAEANGLVGRAYIDSGGPHQKGDEWINQAGELAEAAFFDTEYETTKRPRGYQDRLDAPAIYIGWYRGNAYGPWGEPRWSVPPGAIAYHLHSFSATTVRSASERWLGPLVNQGYCATFGYVYEPYLELTVRPQLFLQFLLQGKNFGDAILLSTPAFSWQTLAIGDPLYQPFKKSLEEQVEDSMEGPYSAYLGLRELNRLESGGADEEALAYARKLFVERPSLAIAYRLASMYEDRGKEKEALEVLRVIRFINSFSRDEYALVQRIADKLHQFGATEMAFDLYEKLLSERDLPKVLRIALLEGGVPVASAMGKAALSSRWNMEANTLKQPPTPKK